MTSESKTPEERISSLEDGMSTVLDMLEDLSKQVKGMGPKKGGLFGGKRTKTAIKDTKTGIVYPSKAGVGKALAGKDDFADLDPGNSFVYYQMIGKSPERFVDATEAEAEKVWADGKLVAEKERAESQKRLDAEAEGAKK